MNRWAAPVIVALLVACGLPSPSPPDSDPTASPPSQDDPTAAEIGVVEPLIGFSRSLDVDELAAIRVPADGLWLGLSDRLIVMRTRDELVAAEAWRLNGAFRGRVGPFSALELLAGADGIEVIGGDHPHCAAAAVPPPAQVADLRRIAVQPTGISSCLEWWTVDLFITAEGTIAAVTLDLWEP